MSIGPGRDPSLGRKGPVRDERGQVAGLEMVFFGVLIFVVGILVIGNVWAVVDARIAADDAAREAARAFVQAPDAAGAATAAEVAARDALTSEGRDGARASISIDGALARCARITVSIAYPVGLVGLPWLGRPGRLLTVHASQSELVDPYRSGLSGTASCAAG